MKKTLNFGKIAYQNSRKTNRVTVEMELKEDKQGRPVFSCSASVWDHINTDILMGGQCLDDLNKPKYRGQLKDPSLFYKIWTLWKAHRLNDLNAGTPEQEKELEAAGIRDYTEAVEHLKLTGLYEMPHPETGEPYKYGHGWIYRPIHEEALKAIKEIIQS